MPLFDAIRRESRYLSDALRMGLGLRGVSENSRSTAADIVEGWAKKAPNAVAICFEDRLVTYAELDTWGNRYAHWAQAQGIKWGDVVALLMENRPEYIFAWLGMAKIGAVTALINTHLSGAPLAHCLRISGARHCILGRELVDAYASAQGLLEPEPQVWIHGSPPELQEPTLDPPEPDEADEPELAGALDLDAALDRTWAAPLEGKPREGMRARDKLFYIYTSGTTGNPKAANISHMRFQLLTAGFAAAAKVTPSDRIYVVLPLYHTAGGVLAVGMALHAGACIVLRRRFSASQFWSDCVKYDVTIFQYIGELCRYLLNAPITQDEREHKVRLCAGNGLRPEIWESFQQRFGIPRIFEFYGATEGNVAIMNSDGKVGSVGRLPFYLNWVFHVRLIRFDVEHEVPVRGEKGRCIECRPGEVGEAIGLIPKRSLLPIGHFEGYANAEATEKKILRDVFKNGDAWFRTGDLMRKDERGYFYFVDRIGDTFRWKGENVSTSEVAEVISVYPGVLEANVYGVEVPGAEGRAGMAALVVDTEFDLEALPDYLEAHLAPYARPLFIRLQREIETTGTFKHKKMDLVKQGFDPLEVLDLLYFADPESHAFAPLDRKLHDRLVAGEFRF
ncbi:MAG: long-chain-acyl-CoA synthetase [Deltaproteobacteria bacterium]|nr:long-chain-acyl-CoA synthetase [Deltaproteobacteria bacterium]